eukprot:jgi/Tetstr1/432767/TSEL_002329.t1
MSQLNPDSYGKVKVVVVGNSGAGKTSLCQYIVSGGKPPEASPPSTPGCQVHTQLLRYRERGGAEQQFFLELWDVGAHRRYESLRCCFYKQVNGVIFVHDSSAGQKGAALSRWATEVLSGGTFEARLSPGVAAVNAGGLPVPVLVVDSKADKLGSASRATYPWGSLAAWLSQLQAQPDRSGADVAMDTDRSIGGLKTSVQQGAVDLHAIDAFFHKLIERRYYAASAAGVAAAPAAARPGLGAFMGGVGGMRREEESCGSVLDMPGEGRLDAPLFEDSPPVRPPVPWMHSAAGGAHDGPVHGRPAARAGSGRLFE